LNALFESECNHVASITIRNLDDEVKDLLRQLAAENGCSMEEQARAMIRAAVEGRAGQADRIGQIEETLRALTGLKEQATPVVAASGKPVSRGSLSGKRILLIIGAASPLTNRST
jgi:phosphopantothenoylcysteine decarboxylase/phosphopantothenate--cysteine ligase